MEIATTDTKKKLKLSDDVFSYNYNEGLIHQAVTTFLNNGRSGNSAQKTRSEVRGGGAKPWAQKGTGRARAGTIRSPIWRSGGVTFAAKKRDYTKKINKKMYKRAMRSIISELARKGDLIILDEFKLKSHKTKEFLQEMTKLNLNNALLVLSDISENEYLATRNLIDYEVCDTYSLDPVGLLKYEKVVITSESISKLEELLK